MPILTYTNTLSYSSHGMQFGWIEHGYAEWMSTSLLDDSVVIDGIILDTGSQGLCWEMHAQLRYRPVAIPIVVEAESETGSLNSSVESFVEEARFADLILLSQYFLTKKLGRFSLNLIVYEYGTYWGS